LWHVCVLLEILPDHFEDLWEFLQVLFEHVNCRSRVLPVSPDVLGASRKVVVIVVIELIDCHMVTALSESHVASDMHLLGPVLQVKPDVDHAFFLGLGILVGEHE